jgi:hypothetical protein
MPLHPDTNKLTNAYSSLQRTIRINGEHEWVGLRAFILRHELMLKMELFFRRVRIYDAAMRRCYDVYELVDDVSNSALRDPRCSSCTHGHDWWVEQSFAKRSLR